MTIESTVTEPPQHSNKIRRWPWIVGILAALMVGLGIGAAAAPSDDVEPAATSDRSTEVEILETTVDTLIAERDQALAERDQALADLDEVEAQLADAQTEPEPEPPAEPAAAAEPAAPALTTSQEQAIGSAENYLSFMSFSRTGLIDQLEFEGFTAADAEFAVDALAVDWNEQAVAKAEEYLDFMSFSRQGLIDQLEFEGFTRTEAEYGVTGVGL